jgi:nitrate reductase assembly molybdenum cofactor insertion protein NarJ
MAIQALTCRVLSAWLDYPSVALVDSVPDAVAALDADPGLDPDIRVALRRFADYLLSRSLLELEAETVRCSSN